MTQTRIKPVSSKRARLNRERRKVIALVWERDRHSCRRCKVQIYHEADSPTIERIGDVHELLPRGRGGSITDSDNCVLICRKCHDWIRDEPVQALVDGWLRSQFNRPEPTAPLIEVVHCYRCYTDLEDDSVDCAGREIGVYAKAKESAEVIADTENFNGNDFETVYVKTINVYGAKQ